MSQKLWGGRFSKPTHNLVELYTSSLSIDMRLWRVDIFASQAHARMLGQVGVLTMAESEQLVTGLAQVAELMASANYSPDSKSEDVHSEVERLLFTVVGDVAGKLHTARSRNDQVATDTRLYLRGQVDELLTDIKTFQLWLITEAEQNLQTLLPGLTHTQHGQPVSFAHHLMAYFWMLQRDCERLVQLRARINVLPLGSSALAGTSFPLDRHMVAQELGFEAVSENSLDAVSDRDFAVEFISASSLIMMHLSRLCEELILWSAPEFGFVTLDDSVTTGSSIMPQKKNPDVAELVRGRTGRVYGHLMGLLTTLKALPLAYNRDLQEDKVYLFESLDIVSQSLSVVKLMLDSATFHREKMAAALKGDFSNATDIADDLVRKGLPFRAAHEVVGRIVVFCLESKKPLEELTLKELKKFDERFDEESLKAIPHNAVMAARKSFGGTSPQSVIVQLANAKAALKM